MSDKRAYPMTLIREPRGALYRALLFESLKYCWRVSLVVREQCILEDSGKTLLQSLAPYLRNERIVSEWPGTKLLGSTAILREYELCDSTVGIFADATDGLYEWCQPERPEDPVFWRGTGLPWLATIAHERDAYFEISQAERDALLQKMPDLAIALE